MPPTLQTAQSQVLPLPALVGDGVPDWVHLLPADAGGIRTFDGRGPYHLADIEGVIAASFEDPRGLPIDENHSTDFAAPKGGPSPARGWVREMKARVDGLWGRVEWTRTGRELLADHAYRGISPVFAHAPDGRVLRVLRASLTNTPNLRGLTALHSEDLDPMDELQKIAAALGLAATATADEAVAKIGELKGSTALQSALSEIGTALGVEGEPSQAEVATAAKLAKAAQAETATLRTELTAVQSELTTLKAGQARAASEAYVDAEMAKGRVGLNATTRDDLVALHMTEPERAERLMGAMPIVGRGARQEPKGGAAGEFVSLNSEQLAVAKVLGLAPEAYLKTLQAERALKGVA